MKLYNHESSCLCTLNFIQFSPKIYIHWPCSLFFFSFWNSSAPQFKCIKAHEAVSERISVQTGWLFVIPNVSSPVVSLECGWFKLSRSDHFYICTVSNCFCDRENFWWCTWLFRECVTGNCRWKADRRLLIDCWCRCSIGWMKKKSKKILKWEQSLCVWITAINTAEQPLAYITVRTLCFCGSHTICKLLPGRNLMYQGWAGSCAKEYWFNQWQC